MPPVGNIGKLIFFINFADHNPPHFHAEYHGFEAIIDIKKLKVIKGIMPDKQLSKAITWASTRQDELMIRWDLAQKKLPVSRIK